MNTGPPPLLTPLVSFPRRNWRWRGGLEAAFASEVGSAYAQNEDNCTHSPSAKSPLFCGVADGVGGGAHGDIASSVLLAHCVQAPKRVYSDPVRLVEWLYRADAEVRAAVARRTDQPGAATLAAVWFLSSGKAQVVNVGDCRVYRLKPHNGRYAVEQLTLDQTYANVGQPPPVNGSPDDPARMVGVGVVGRPPVMRARIREGELLLLCSDGVHKFVSPEQISDMVSVGLTRGPSLEAICATLVQAAKTNGSYDDASALLVLRHPWFGVRAGLWCALGAAALLWLTAMWALASPEERFPRIELPSLWEQIARMWREWTGM